MSGFYLMHRGWMDNPVFKDEPYTEREAWEWIISHAAYAPTVHRVGGALVSIGRGQIAVTLRDMAEAWKWSKDRAARFLKTLQKADMICAETATQARQAKTVITVCNYSKYQVAQDTTETETATQTRQEPRQERDTDETLKKEGKEVKEKNKIPSSLRSEGAPQVVQLPLPGAPEPRPDDEPASLDKRVFDRGVEVLGPRGRGIVAKLKSAMRGDLVGVLALLNEAAGKSNPTEYVMGALKRHATADPPPRPKWPGGVIPMHAGAGG